MRTHVLGALLVMGLTGSAAAMGIRSEVRVLAWAKDGHSVALDEEASGPEGGGAHSIAVISTGTPHVVRFALSSDFSPGDGSRPEHVSAAACLATAKKLAARLKAFPGVRVQPALCKGARGQIVAVNAAKQQALTVTALPGGGLSLRAAGKQLELVKDGKAVVTFASGGWSVEGITGTLGPAGHLLVLLTEGGFRALGSLSGKPSDLVPIAP